jgi:flagellar basal body L-ring protein FlgH
VSLSRAARISRALGAAAPALAAVVLFGIRASAEGLWGSENLIGERRIEVGDVVTIVVAEARPEGDARTTGESPGGQAVEVAARVVKVLPNGNLVLEARMRLGEGSLLLSGEVARADVSSEGTVRLSRAANLAVVARGLEPGALARIIAAAARTLEAAAESGPQAE